MYASNAWWGFAKAHDRQKIFAFIRRCIRTGFCSPNLADFHDLYNSSDEKLFNKILTCPNHILRTLLPPPTAQNYSLRNRPHNRQLPDRISRITDCNFTVRMFYRNMYWLLYILDLRFVLFLCTTAVWQFAINEYVIWTGIRGSQDGLGPAANVCRGGAEIIVTPSGCLLCLALSSSSTRSRRLSSSARVLRSTPIVLFLRALQTSNAP